MLFYSYQCAIINYSIFRRFAKQLKINSRRRLMRNIKLFTFLNDVPINMTLAPVEGRIPLRYSPHLLPGLSHRAFMILNTMAMKKESLWYKILEWIISITVVLFIIYKLYELISLNN